MKHFYNAKPSATVTRSAAKALGTALSSTKTIFMLVLLGFFLLVSREGFGQTAYRAVKTGNWNDPTTWSTTGTTFPGANDDVLIDGTFTVTLPTGITGTCKSLTLTTSGGQVRPAIIINGNITLGRLHINAANNGNNAVVDVTVRSGGSLKIISEAIAGPNKYNFVCEPNSTVIYGAAINLLIPKSGSSQNNVAGTPGPYHNLIIENTGASAATISANLTVNGSLSILNGGKLSIGSNAATTPATPFVLTLGQNAEIATVEDASNFISGTVQTARAIKVGANNFGNIGANITSISDITTPVTIVRTTGIAPIAIGSNSSATRTYQVLGGPASGLSASFNFLQHELNQDLANYILYSQAPAANFSPVAGSIRSDYVFSVESLQNHLYTIAAPPVPLPVELVSFKAQRHAHGVNLTWATASEKDNSGFEVQVSTDGKKFEKIGFVKSEVGTTSMAQRYSFLDTKAVSGTRYYRLAQIDFDGTTTYSAIRAIALDGANGEIAAYPNPFEEVVTVKLNGVEARKVNVTLTNSLGKVILEQQEETAGNTITVNTSGVTIKGVYMLHVVDNGEKHTFKLMKR